MRFPSHLGVSRGPNPADGIRSPHRGLTRRPGPSCGRCNSSTAGRAATPAARPGGHQPRSPPSAGWPLEKNQDGSRSAHGGRQIGTHARKVTNGWHSRPKTPHMGSILLRPIFGCHQMPGPKTPLPDAHSPKRNRRTHLAGIIAKTFPGGTYPCGRFRSLGRRNPRGNCRILHSSRHTDQVGT